MPINKRLNGINLKNSWLIAIITMIKYQKKITLTYSYFISSWFPCIHVSFFFSNPFAIVYGEALKEL